MEGQHISYDAAGNMTTLPNRQGQMVSLAFDSSNMLRSARDAAGNVIAEYLYDAFGNRVAKKTIGAQPQEEFYLFDGAQKIQSYTSDGTIISEWVRTDQIDETVMESTSAGEQHYFQQDFRHNITSVTDATGALLESYTYTPYGERTVMDAGGNVISGTQIGNDLGFAGRPIDAETGLVNIRARYFSPQLGRFIQRDPIEDLPNSYAYTQNPMVQWDPTGLEGIGNEGDLYKGLWEIWREHWRDPRATMVEEMKALAKGAKLNEKAQKRREEKPSREAQNRWARTSAYARELINEAEKKIGELNKARKNPSEPWVQTSKILGLKLIQMKSALEGYFAALYKDNGKAVFDAAEKYYQANKDYWDAVAELYRKENNKCGVLDKKISDSSINGRDLAKVEFLEDLYNELAPYDPDPTARNHPPIYEREYEKGWEGKEGMKDRFPVEMPEKQKESSDYDYEVWSLKLKINNGL